MKIENQELLKENARINEQVKAVMSVVFVNFDISLEAIEKSNLPN